MPIVKVYQRFKFSKRSSDGLKYEDHNRILGSRFKIDDEFLNEVGGMANLCRDANQVNSSVRQTFLKELIQNLHLTPAAAATVVPHGPILMVV